ncbi:YihY/virulence factor BrkB family protein [Paracraurococcus lichenis]|uniref:YihY/virulence factor BrkB family protein n=1 Tax=Paracraurococcus lichenis TaxID=3064888 RepID=A0ABT9DWY3_9PROT|nr:YihY/virulence factor BrkB family protein [Paracraurococcus sp. LOR1-02]MDO9708410.1 YihY/virulence factor BrkB family protein [Paracraurococcus sp. LOR1-02]
MLRRFWGLVRASVEGYVADDAMSRGAAIAYYCFFSVAPLLVIATAIAGLFFGPQAAEGAVAQQLEALMGDTGAQVVEGLIRGAADAQAGQIAAGIGILVLLFTASSVFTEVQAALNVIWRAPPPEQDTVWHLVRNKLLSIALVLGTGVLLLASLIATAVVAAVTSWAAELVPETGRFIDEVNFALTFAMTALLFAVIYKILPNRHIGWRDVSVGALVTAFLFSIGKGLIGWYIGTAGIGSTYGAAGALMVVLVWIYYSAQIFLLGAEFTKVWAGMQGNAEAQEALAAEPVNPCRRRRPRREAGERKSLAPAAGAAALTAVALTLLKRKK